MNLRKLRYFITIVDAENMTRAAEMLHVAQPALSQQIASLEDSLGVKLLTRNNKGTFPTVEGKMLYSHAKTILRQVENTRSLISKKDESIYGNVSVGMPSSTAKISALPLMQAVKKAHPAIVLEIIDVPSADLATLLMHGRVDFSLIPDPPKTKGIASTPLIMEELFWLTHPDIANKSKNITIEEIINVPLILPSMPNTLRARFEQKLAKKLLSYNLYGEASTSAILIPAVKEGMAATILPYAASYSEIKSNQISMHKIEQGFFRNIYLCTSETHTISPAIATVIEIYKNVIDNLIKTKKATGWKPIALDNHSSY